MVTGFCEFTVAIAATIQDDSEPQQWIPYRVCTWSYIWNMKSCLKI